MTAGTRAPRRGRPPKGGTQRAALIAKLPSDQAAELVRDAETVGLPITDYLALLICERRGWDIPDYITAALTQDSDSRRDEPTLDLGLAS